MYVRDIAIYVLGYIGIMCFILLAGFVEGGNLIAALVCLVIMSVSFQVAVHLDAKTKEKRKR